MNANDDAPTVFLLGKQVYLRPVHADDVQRYCRWLCDPDVRVPLGNVLPYTEQMERDFLEAQSSKANALALAIVLRDGDRHIGGLGFPEIRWKDRAAVFGIFIGEADCRARGYGTEATRLVLGHAFETLNLNRVELWVHAFNAPAIHVYEKVGFVREGVRRDYVFAMGRFYDSYVYSMLAREYFEKYEDR